MGCCPRAGRRRTAAGGGGVVVLQIVNWMFVVRE
jgi:hypothetical protein